MGIMSINRLDMYTDVILCPFSQSRPLRRNEDQQRYPSEIGNDLYKFRARLVVSVAFCISTIFRLLDRFLDL